MGSNRGDSFALDFEPNEILFGSKLKGKLSPRSYPIQCERKWNTSFLSAADKCKLTMVYSDVSNVKIFASANANNEIMGTEVI